jgi:NodT family efflux transporter outer membrane factor (OMF) lipoprotein
MIKFRFYEKAPHFSRTRCGLSTFFSLTVFCVVLSACSVGPDFRRPAPPDVKRYTPAELPERTASAPVTAGEAQRLVLGQDIQEQWWNLFHSEALDGLIRQALINSPTLEAAKAKLREAQENWRAKAGSLYPSVDANASAERQKISGATFGQAGGISPFNLFNASVNVTYSLDIFGGTRRELEALRAQVDYEGYQVKAAYLSLTSNIVTTVAKEASLRAQIETTREILAIQEKTLELVKKQHGLGGASLSDVYAQYSQLARTKTTLPPLEKELAFTRHQLAVLTGLFPEMAGTLPEFDLDSQRLPLELPVSLPSSLVRDRPDIAASEALLHAACAQVGVATADLYPKVTLTGSYGSEAVKLENLFSPGAVVWSVGAGLLQPVFRGGALRAKKRSAVAAYEEAEANYKETVLQAFRDVADALRALEDDARALSAQSESEMGARLLLDLTKKQFELGAANYLSLLNAQRDYQLARMGLVQAEAARFADTAALFQAMGGGVWKGAGKP